MMYSGKPPPLKAFAHGGSPGKDSAASTGMAGLMTSENCDPNHPNLSVFGKEAVRKVGESSPAILDVSNGSTVMLPKPDGAGGVQVAATALSECHNAQQAKEVNRLPAANAASLLPSPTKGPAPASRQHSHGHAGRAPHFCRSPRCASNNPDYATPIQPPPRKYLISKRHLLPGAICTKDPAILARQTQQECFATPQVAPSTGKPPKPSRKLENLPRQPSFATVSSERSTPPPLAYETSPTRIPKPPSARSVHEATASSSPQDFCSNVPLPAPATEAHFSESSSPNADAEQQLVLRTSLEDDDSSQARIAKLDVGGPVWRRSLKDDHNTQESIAKLDVGVPVLRKSLEEDDISQERIAELGVGVPVVRKSLEEDDISQEGVAELDVGGLVHSSRVGSDTSCTVAIDASTPRRASSDEGGSSEAGASLSPAQVDSPVTSAGDEPLSELFTSPEEGQIAPTSMELPEELASDQLAPEPDGSSSESPSVELEDVTEKLAQKLAFETVGTTSPPLVRDCIDMEEMSSADVPNRWTKFEEGSVIFHEQEDTEEQQFSNSERGFQLAEENAGGADCEPETNAEAGAYLLDTDADGENCQFHNHVPAFDNSPSPETTEEGQEEVPRGRSISSYIEEFESAQKSNLTEGQRDVPKFVRGKGRQLWRSDCRDSREVVFLKQTPQPDRRGEEDWMVDSILEGAISKLNPSGHGRVRVLVEAFESLLNLGGQPEVLERRASRVWCLNRMEKGEVDEDGEEFEEGDQRVDCYEVSGDGLQLRASMRLSLGGGNRLPLCSTDEVDEIEMSAIQKVQEWDDDCRQSQSFEDLTDGSLRSQSQPDDRMAEDQENQNEGLSEGSGLSLGDTQRRMSSPESRMLQNDTDRSSEGFSYDAQTESQFGCYTREDVNQGTDARSTFSLDQGYKPKACRRRRFWKANFLNLEPACPSFNCGGGKDQKLVRGTSLEPFYLRTEERGMMKEYQFAQKLDQMFAEEERLRNPIAQGLPWTTDEPQVVPKPPVKGQTRPVEFRHYSNSRAIERAEFDDYMAERAFYMEMQKQEAERLRDLADQEEVKRLRREMVPRAQLMPFFDQPFVPARSSKRLTVPKEPTFLNRQHKRAKCIVWQNQQQNQQQPWSYE